MNEEQKMKFWGDLVEPMTALLGGLLVRGEYKLVDVVKDIVAKAENAALEERKDCADIAEYWSCNGMPRTTLADQIRARGLQELNKEAEKNGEEL